MYAYPLPSNNNYFFPLKMSAELHSIGHMAYAAQNTNIKFSYLHVVSDNLSHKYSFDLSNERKDNVIENSKALMRIIGQAIVEI